MNIATPAGAIVTERLILRRPRMADAHDLTALANNMAVVGMTSRMPYPYTLDDAARFLTAVQTNDGGGQTCAMTLADGGAFMGIVSVEREADGDCELGYWLGEPYWGRGYATEAARALVDSSFLNTDMACLHAVCNVVNAASRRVLQKCGFGFRAMDSGDSLALGKSVALERYSLDRQTWLSLRGSSRT